MRSAFIFMLFCSLAAAGPLNDRLIDDAGAAAARQFPLKTIRSECINFAEVKRDQLRDCRVTEFGEFGRVGRQAYYYVIYCLVPLVTGQEGGCTGDSFTASYFQARGLAVFVRDPGNGESLRLLFERVNEDIGMFVYSEKPEIVHNTAGTILNIPIRLDGTGNGNASEYFLRVANGWQPIESEEWRAELRRRIPSRLGIWKGVWPNLHTMRAEADLYQKGDANCCPTGGTARVRLSVKGQKFVITSLDIDAEP